MASCDPGQPASFGQNARRRRAGEFLAWPRTGVSAHGPWTINSPPSPGVRKPSEAAETSDTRAQFIRTTPMLHRCCC